MNSQAMTANKKEICVGPVEELPEGARRIVQFGTASIGVFNVKGEFYAIRNFCPHEGAELCLGVLTGTNKPTDRCGEYQWEREGTDLRCPWHAWEFDLETGTSLFDSKLRVKTYQTSIRQGELWVEEKITPKR